MANGSYPARLGIDAPLEIKNWRPLVNWFLAIPQYLVLYALRVLRQVLTIIAFFTILFTGRYPAGMRAFLIGVSRWSLRVYAHAGLLRDKYPPFSLEDGAPGGRGAATAEGSATPETTPPPPPPPPPPTAPPPPPAG
jgi:hypothetical protein